MYLQEKTKYHSGTVLALALTVSALFLPFINIKKNRIDLGEVVKLNSFSGVILLLYCVIILLLIATSTPLIFKNIRENRGLLIIRQFIGLGIVALLWLIVDEVSNGLQNKSIITLESGFYLNLLAGYFMTIGSVQILKGKKTQLRFIPYFFLFLIIILFIAISGDRLGIVLEFVKERGRFVKELIIHLNITFKSVFFAILFGIPMGVIAWKNRILNPYIFGFINTLQTIPSLALFGLLIAPLSYISNKFPVLKSMGLKGIGETPALIALTLYALLPIVRNCYVGLGNVSFSVLESGRGMGMNSLQRFKSIQLPLALPIIFTGFKIAIIQTLGNTAIAALIGAGGLGFFVFRGLEQIAPDLILLGVIPIVLLVLIFDKSLTYLIKILTPKGLRGNND